DPSGMTVDELGDEFHALDRQRRLVEAALAGVVAEADRSGAFRVDGHVSVSGWVRALGRWSNAEVMRCRRVGDLAVASERFAEALTSGVVGVAQAHELGRAFANPRCGGELVDELEALLARADRVPHAEFRDRVEGWIVVHDRDGAHRDRDWGHQQRDAWMSIFDGVGHGGFSGGAADVVTMREIFDRFRDAEFGADWDATVARHGDTATFELMPRTDAQRRFDALLAIFQRAAAQHPDAVAVMPVVNLVADIHTVDELLNAVPTLTGGGDPWDRRCHTTNGVPVAPGELLAAMWWGRVRAVVVDSSGVVIAMGRRRRLFTGSAREAVLLGSSRCVWPGCVQPSGRCQADHRTEWADHGATDPDNGSPLCGRHNRWKSRGYTTWRDPDGTWHTRRPDGTEIN
ncbi:MAG: HNH endonuclease signature motif containing protein, partial [Ilumatobacteraceae bacterium]